MRLMRFNPQAEYVPGKQMVVADTLSRSPCKLGQEPNTVEDVLAFVDLVESTRPATSDQLKRIREASAKDAQLLKVMGFTLEGWRTCNDIVINTFYFRSVLRHWHYDNRSETMLSGFSVE